MGGARLDTTASVAPRTIQDALLGNVRRAVRHVGKDYPRSGTSFVITDLQ